MYRNSHKSLKNVHPGTLLEQGTWKSAILTSDSDNDVVALRPTDWKTKTFTHLQPALVSGAHMCCNFLSLKVMDKTLNAIDIYLRWFITYKAATLGECP